MTFRPYDHEKDHDAAVRIWREVGWLSGDETREIDEHLTSSRSLVAEIDGVAECLVMTNPGTVRHLETDLPLGIVIAVTTSRVARKQGLAGRLTARAIAADVADGASVSALGMFEQGFYDKLGFGTGSYVHRFAFSPASLRVPYATRPPRRLSEDDYEIVHRNRLDRHRGHGACTITPSAFTRADILERSPKGFGLGYFDGPGGTLSHHFWVEIRDSVETGPYFVDWMAWQTPAQFRELLGVIRNLGDQVHLVYIREAHNVQLQPLATKPIALRETTVGSKFDARMRVLAYWQMRINDVPACVAATKLAVTAPLRFNLRLTDPIERFLDADEAWRGVGGDYVVTFGPESGAEPGADAALPTLATSVNSFTRLWLGVAPASSLALTDDIDAPSDLLADLDRTVRLPSPQPDWDF
jgi:predicted acetyltransferase